jgi:hypothetical protein
MVGHAGVGKPGTDHVRLVGDQLELSAALRIVALPDPEKVSMWKPARPASEGS